MKKGLTVSVMATFLSISMLTACNTDNRDVANRDMGNRDMADRNDNVNIDPIHYNLNGQQLNGQQPNNVLRREYRFDMSVLPDNKWTQEPNVTNKLQAYPRADLNQQGSTQYQQRNQTQDQDRNNVANNRTNQTDQAVRQTSDFQAQVIQLTNEERKKNGLPALKSDSKLLQVAQTKSDDMANNNYFSHTSPTYGSPFQMLKHFGVSYTTAAENIAAGQTSPQSVVNSWMKSAGHRKNILNKNITHIGVGYSKDEAKGSYWTQMFIGK